MKSRYTLWGARTPSCTSILGDEVHQGLICGRSLTSDEAEWMWRCKTTSKRFAFFCTSWHYCFQFSKHDTYTPNCEWNLVLSKALLPKLCISTLNRFFFTLYVRCGTCWCESHLPTTGQTLEFKVILKSMMIATKSLQDFLVDMMIVYQIGRSCKWGKRGGLILFPVVRQISHRRAAGVRSDFTLRLDGDQCGSL